jgi:hypothetical protein
MAGAGQGTSHGLGESADVRVCALTLPTSERAGNSKGRTPGM